MGFWRFVRLPRQPLTLRTKEGTDWFAIGLGVTGMKKPAPFACKLGLCDGNPIRSIFWEPPTQERLHELGVTWGRWSKA